MTAASAPRVLMIAQWPSIKNAEYELIERVRRTGYKITVVDILGFDVDTGRCINDERLCDEYDFAVSLHYETPKFLNIRTFHWVANPLEFIHAQGNYRTHLIHHLRSYDDYMYNGSEYLKQHVRTMVGAEWTDSGLHFYQSCSRSALIPPRGADAPPTDRNAKLFYCGVNWEAISDKEGRAQGLLEILQERGIADFYGPRLVLGVNVWADFTSYCGEIPFDGMSMFPAMHDYAAVLALSSPAHIKSHTSSGRVLEGFAGGVPVISDQNPHVRTQFGDLVYYFEGDTEEERADSIQAALEGILADPAAAAERVRAAQELISREYCFEACFEEAARAVDREKAARAVRGASPGGPRHRVDVFLFPHDPYAPDKTRPPDFDNVPYIVRAMSEAAHAAEFRLVCWPAIEVPADLPECIELVRLENSASDVAGWTSLRLGEKVSRLSRRARGDHVVFFTEFDYPQYDYFTKALAWFDDSVKPGEPGLHVAGFFVNDLSAPAPMSSAGILRCSASNGLYRWTQNSIAEHQLGQLCFNRAALQAIDMLRFERFDVLLPMVAVLECMDDKVAIWRSRHLLLRTCAGLYHRYHDLFRRVEGKGLWAQHYELLSNTTHEINGLYDAFQGDREVVAIADKLLGIDIPAPPPAVQVPVPVVAPPDPAVLAVNHFLNRISPYVVAAKKVGRVFGIK